MEEERKCFTNSQLGRVFLALIVFPMKTTPFTQLPFIQPTLRVWWKGVVGGGNKSAPEDKTTPNEPLIALLALLLVHYRPADLWSTTSFLARTVIILLRKLYRL